MTAHGGALQGDHTLRAKHAPRNPPQTPLGNPLGSGDPDADDQEVTLLTGGGWVALEQPF